MSSQDTIVENNTGSELDKIRADTHKVVSNESESVSKCVDRALNNDGEKELQLTDEANVKDDNMRKEDNEKHTSATEDKNVSKSIECIQNTTHEEDSGDTNINSATEKEDNNKPKVKTSDQYDPKHIHYEGNLAVYKDPSSNYEYTWNNETQEWSLRNNENYGFEDDTHTYIDKDGVKYFWDKNKSAWFPKIDDDFMAMYQLNYGFVDNTEETKSQESQSDITKEEIPAPVPGQKRKAKEPEWFEVDEEHNTNVYVSNLPLNITEEEFVNFMQKCGLVMRDLTTGKMKVKLYTEKGTNVLKGDALCTYIKKESVDLALNVLDGYNYNGQKIKVERAKFQLKGTYDPSLKPKRKKKDKEKMKKIQEKLFDWRPEKLRGQRAKHEKIVIVKNAFEPSMFDHDVSLILEIQKDLREECSKLGEVRKVVLFDRHPEGVIQINMKAAEEADEVIKLLDGRWYNKKQLSAEIWDGKTKFRIAETDSEISNRLNKWNNFLENEEEGTKSTDVKNTEPSTT